MLFRSPGEKLGFEAGIYSPTHARTPAVWLRQGGVLIDILFIFHIHTHTLIDGVTVYY